MPNALLKETAHLAAVTARMQQLASNLVWKETLGKVSGVIVPLNEGGNTPPLYCIHSLSGKATDYVQLAALLGTEQPFFGIQIPSKNRNPRFGDAVATITIQSVAQYYADCIQQFQAAGTLALAGWSFGAIIALEIARQLRARGRFVKLVAAFDMAPNTGAGPSLFDLRSVIELARSALPWIKGHELMKQSSWSFCIGMLKRLFGASFKASPFSAGESLVAGLRVEQVFDVSAYPADHVLLMQKMLDAMIDYAPAPYDGNVQVYVASNQVAITHFLEMKTSWRKIAPNAEISFAKGSHRSMIESPDGKQLAQHLARQLAEG